MFLGGAGLPVQDVLDFHQLCTAHPENGYCKDRGQNESNHAKKKKHAGLCT